jgi:bifunctional non-homologous end joining protein LigD
VAQRAVGSRGERVEVEVEGRRLRLSNLDKVMYPAVGFTKGQVIDYYTRIAPVLLPYLRGRPLTLKRYPDGVEGHFFYEKQCPSHRPDWVATAPIRTGRKTIDFCLANDLPTLVWAANLADLELHTSLSAAEAIERPTTMVFDLDPGEPAGLAECAEVALALHELLDRVSLRSCVKTSGSKGLQVYVPLNTPVSYDETKPFAHAIARHLEGERPGLVVSSQKRSIRSGKVLIDWSQNDEHKTTVCVYSLRARERPTVSTPLTWDELEEPASLVFDTDAVLARVEGRGDLFAPVLDVQQTLPEV